MGWIFCSLFVLSFITGQSQAQKEGPSVSITTGDLFGVVEKSFSGIDYFSFKGVPYAEPPVGELRFKPPEDDKANPPVPKKAWSEIFNATTDGKPCLQLYQFDETQTIGSEDCLFLNVYTKNLPAKTKQDLKPVIVYIHGGRWLVGSASSKGYSPLYMMDQDVVMVHIQYRLGALGFLSTEDAVAPGNYGLLDQVEALKWIQANIQSFGGNPNQVTVMGQSAGGASTHMHFLSPLSKGLIHGGFALSGNAATIWSNRYTIHDEVAKKQASLVGCPTDTSEVLIECLRNIDAKALTRTQTNLHDYFAGTPAKLPLTPYFPRVDKESENPFMPEFGNEMLKKGDFQKFPLMLGVTSQEAAWFAAPFYGEESLNKLKQMDEDFLTFFDSILTYTLTEEQRKEVIKYYFNNQPLANLSMIVPFSEMMSDCTFNFETIMSAYYHARQSMAPVFLYIFHFRGEWSFAEEFEEVPRTYDGVAHVDDLRYLFRMPYGPELSEEEVVMMKRYTGFAAEMATYGKPTGGNPDTVYDLEWSPYQKGNGLYLVIDTPEKSRMTKDVPFETITRPGRMVLWRRLLGYSEDFLEDFQFPPHTEL